MLNGGLWKVTRQYSGVTRVSRTWSGASVADRRWAAGAPIEDSSACAGETKAAAAATSTGTINCSFMANVQSGDGGFRNVERSARTQPRIQHTNHAANAARL